MLRIYRTKKRGLNEYLEVKLKLHIKAVSVLKPQIIFDMVLESLNQPAIIHLPQIVF